MNKQTQFYEHLGEIPPLNRRVYAAATASFAYIWEFLIWATRPWRAALPFAFAASTLLKVVVGNEGGQFRWGRFIADVASVGVVWTVFLGTLFAVFAVFNAFRR